mmetsp:Transcript_530/g.941  ORF Transcript_530/g.941 Transcript_530/m.941 type:complete len:1347 (+) Transcript_530:93-4133(+)
MDDRIVADGREALHHLEEQLKGPHTSLQTYTPTHPHTHTDPIETHIYPTDADTYTDYDRSSNAQRSNLLAERRLLDIKPRDARLQSRLGSPLGLTLEELDDRGLLEGGGVVPSYYTSMRQQNRRHLEMRKRSSRLQRRGHEDEVKLKSSGNIIRMIRVLVRKGLNLDELFGNVDFDGRGIIEKDQFVGIIRNLGLPCAYKDIMSFVQRYAVSSQQIDYDAFINEAVREAVHSLDGEDSLEGSASGPAISSPSSNAVVELKRMLIDSKNRLHKSYDDIYRMFSKWDSSGRGMVTITQFFRVLAQLHVVFNDRDQDFIAELLDSDGKGKVDFEALLSYCFTPSEDDTSSPRQEGTNGTGGTGDGDESLSLGGSTAVGTAVSGEARSSSGMPGRRPRTASAFRGQAAYSYHDDGDSYTGGTSHEHGAASPGVPGHLSQPSPGHRSQRRPLTASARVLHGEYRARDKTPNGGGRRPQSAKRSLSEDTQGFILDIPSGDEEDEILMREGDDGTASHTLELVSPESVPRHVYGPPFGADTRHQQTADYYYEPSYGDMRSQPIEYESGIPDSSVPYSRRDSGRAPRKDSDLYDEPVYVDMRPSKARRNGSSTEDIPSHLPIDNSTQAVSRGSSGDQCDNHERLPDSRATGSIESAETALRKAVLEKEQHRKCLRDIFAMFDQKFVRFFDSRDLQTASESAFGLQFGPITSNGLVRRMAVEGYDRVSYSDFVTFVRDPEYKILEDKLQQRIADQLEQQGREYQYLLFTVLSQEGAPTSAVTSGDSEPDQSVKNSSPNSGLVSASSFGNSLKKLGLQLSPTEIERIVTKFDTHGTGMCSVSRFMNMLQNSEHWKFALDTLAYHEEAAEECQVVRQRMKSNARHAINTEFDEETLEMAEYLGIRILSEPHLLWIVSEAIKAPLPEGWSVHQDKQGRTFFFHAPSNSTRWDHPLDPHFRKLRNDGRKRTENQYGDMPPRPSDHSYNTNVVKSQHLREQPIQDDKVYTGQAKLTPHDAEESTHIPQPHANSSSEEKYIEEDDDDMSDYYRLKNRSRGSGKDNTKPPAHSAQTKLMSREAKRPVSAQDRSAHESSHGNRYQEPAPRRHIAKGPQSAYVMDDAGKQSNRPVSAPYDRMEGEHTYRKPPEKQRHASTLPHPVESRRGEERINIFGSRTNHTQSHGKQGGTHTTQQMRTMILPGGGYPGPVAGGGKGDRRGHGKASRTRNSERVSSKAQPKSYRYTYHGRKELVRASSAGRTRPSSQLHTAPIRREDKSKLDIMFQDDVLDMLDEKLSRSSQRNPANARPSTSSNVQAENEVRRRSSEGGRSEGRYRTSISRDEYESSSRPGEKDHEKIIWL